MQVFKQKKKKNEHFVEGRPAGGKGEARRSDWKVEIKYNGRDRPGEQLLYMVLHKGLSEKG